VAGGSVSSCGMKEGSDASLEDLRLGGPSPIESEGKPEPESRQDGCWMEREEMADKWEFTSGAEKAREMGTRADKNWMDSSWSNAKRDRGPAVQRTLGASTRRPRQHSSLDIGTGGFSIVAAAREHSEVAKHARSGLAQLQLTTVGAPCGRDVGEG
jgi:hypothetical protein